MTLRVEGESIPKELLVHFRAAGDLAGIEQLTQVAPITWQHINFYGRYEFTSRVAPIDLERVVAGNRSGPSVELRKGERRK